MRSGFTYIYIIYIYAEGYVDRFTITPCSENLVNTHNESLHTREDLGLRLLHASPAVLPTHKNREKGDYSCKKNNLEIGLHYSKNTLSVFCTPLMAEEMTPSNKCASAPEQNCSTQAYYYYIMLESVS